MIYFVATPIGNLKDITYRAIEVLNNVDVIACEDTRNSLKLLNHYNISKKLIAYHKNNEIISSDVIINLAKNGKNVAVISDAGMPVISDPGNILIKKLIEEEIEYTVVPGASASLSALLLSGMDSSKFTFIGFLNEQNKQRRQQLEMIKNYETTRIFYVSPYNLKKDIESLYNTLGDRKACFVNEITKMYEKTIHFRLSDLPEMEIRGEYVLIVEGATKQETVFDQSPKEQLLELINGGVPKNDAIKQVAKQRGLPKNEIYKIAIDIK